MHIQFSNVGLSKCTLVVIDNSVIRKISASEEYNTRLQEQAKKQKEFSHIFTNKSGSIFTPRILNEGMLDGRFYFDMECIHGKNVNKFLSTVAPEELESTANKLKEYIYFFATRVSKYHDEQTVKSAFLEKLQQLRIKTNYKKFNDNLCTLIEATSLDNIPNGFCHGDLTLANMIFHSDKIYLVDFLDSYLDSYFIDISKLKQDLFFQWTIDTGEMLSYESVRIRQSSVHLWKIFSKEFEFILSNKSFQILDAINYLRIEPYIITPTHRRVLSNIIIRLEKELWQPL